MKKWPGTTGGCRRPGRFGSCAQNQCQMDWTVFYLTAEQRLNIQLVKHTASQCYDCIVHVLLSENSIRENKLISIFLLKNVSTL